MFEGAELFNGDITNWDLSSVVAMQKMFKNAKSFNRDICSTWNVESVCAVGELWNLFEGTRVGRIDVMGWEWIVYTVMGFHGEYKKDPCTCM